jgi:hypothetical protein
MNALLAVLAFLLTALPNAAQTKFLWRRAEHLSLSQAIISG